MRLSLWEVSLVALQVEQRPPWPRTRILRQKLDRGSRPVWLAKVGTEMEPDYASPATQAGTTT